MKFSILISSFNKGKYIEKCITSCLKQKEKDYEIIVFDNYSTDNTLKILKRFETIKEYVDKKDELVRLKNKQWKRLNKEIKEMEVTNKDLLSDFEFYKRKIECEAGVQSKCSY